MMSSCNAVTCKKFVLAEDYTFAVQGNSSVQRDFSYLCFLETLQNKFIQIDAMSPVVDLTLNIFCDYPSLDMSFFFHKHSEMNM